ncbi:PREDICTED: uncharacterized protein LOC101298042 [Fragaria vesca subsp. vesca]|uniref:uncharacterized protein LOC101298042 n=1 Tax=Fragaria vesca subsp. vesca TaxID=101020 RepID=UPI0002C33028|nr:PREDICTED: uncharacterized protein LOC101298042 [Fragaria vesca subsp. vesca]
MQSRLVLGWGSRGGGIKNSAGSATACCAKKPELLRLLATKTPDRAAVHGLKRPVTHKIINEEEVKEEIEKAKQEKEEKRKEVEKTVESQLDRPDKIYPPS